MGGFSSCFLLIIFIRLDCKLEGVSKISWLGWTVSQRKMLVLIDGNSKFKIDRQQHNSTLNFVSANSLIAKFIRYDVSLRKWVRLDLVHSFEEKIGNFVSKIVLYSIHLSFYQWQKQFLLWENIFQYHKGRKWKNRDF